MERLHQDCGGTLRESAGGYVCQKCNSYGLAANDEQTVKLIDPDDPETINVPIDKWTETVKGQLVWFGVYKKEGKFEVMSRIIGTEYSSLKNYDEIPTHYAAQQDLERSPEFHRLAGLDPI